MGNEISGGQQWRWKRAEGKREENLASSFEVEKVSSQKSVANSFHGRSRTRVILAMREAWAVGRGLVRGEGKA
jgi:hypothetical protein